MCLYTMSVLKISGAALICIGLSFFGLRLAGLLNFISTGVMIVLLFGLPAFGAFLFFCARYLSRPAGIDNDGIYKKSSLTARGILAWLLGFFLTTFYVIIYWGNGIQLSSIQAGESSYSLHDFFTHHVYSLLDPLAYTLSGQASSNWFFYGSLYTFAVLVFGIRMLLKYRHNPYQIVRTFSVMFFQLGFAYIIPNLLKLFSQPEYYFSYFWPLKPEYFYPQTWIESWGAGAYFLGFGAFMSFVGTPVLTYFFGKRWYCSWVCGCGGLAETMGDPFRQLSNKSVKSWQLERWLIHLVLTFVCLVTLLLWLNSVGSGFIFGKYSYPLQKAYGFYIGALFSGIIGVGFYPLLGSRVWCRFGCPMAAILGMLQKWFSRFRITTNGGQCISCGNCSTYCEMGIDVRWYAQRGQNIIRSSCVGCGVCASVCPRGVLKLENPSTVSSNLSHPERYNGENPILWR